MQNAECRMQNENAKLRVCDALYPPTASRSPLPFREEKFAPLKGELSQPQVVTEGYATTPTDLNRIYSAARTKKVTENFPRDRNSAFCTLHSAFIEPRDHNSAFCTLHSAFIEPRDINFAFCTLHSAFIL